MKLFSFLRTILMVFLLMSAASCEDTTLLPDDGDVPGQGTGGEDNPDRDGQEEENPDGDGDEEENPDGDEEQKPDENTYSISSAEELTALGEVPAGSTVVWKNGTYDDTSLELRLSGTKDAPVVFKAETPGGVTFTGTSSIKIYGTYTVVSGFRWLNPEASGEHLIRFMTGSSYCTLRDCEVDASGSQPRGEGNTFKWVSLNGTGHTVTHNNFNEKRNMGALLVVWLEEGVTAGHTISYNRFARTDTIYDDEGEPANEQEIIRVGDSSSSMQDAGCTVEYNYFYHCNGERAEIVSNKSCGNTYRGNAFYESAGTLTLRHGNGCLVTGNYFYGSDIEDTGGVRIIGENHIVENNVFERLNSVGYKAALCICSGQENPSPSGYWQVKNAVVRNNTFIDCNLAMHINYGGSSNMTLPVVSTRIEGNVAVAKDKSVYYVVRYEDTAPQADITWEDNTFYGKFKNNYFQLTSVSARPEVDSCLDDIERVAAAAGPSWE